MARFFGPVIAFLLMKRWLLAVPLAVSFTITAPLLAQEKKAAAGEVRRDPEGLKGISPFWEALKKGDDLYVARDLDGAITQYKDAISKAAQNPMGHYRIGEAHLAKGDLQEAEASWVAALRYVGKDGVLKAKIMFVLADLRERQKSYDDAVERWTAYGTFATQQTSVKAYPATATERKKKVEGWKKISAESAEVKKRIEARLKEADAKAKKDAEASTKER
jgi:tetratricopeptide (TPR) repeat protein